MNNSLATEIWMCIMLGSLPVLFTLLCKFPPIKMVALSKTVAPDEDETSAIELLKNALEEEREKTRRLQSVVYHMMGKLYEDELNIQDMEVAYLFGETAIGEDEKISPVKEGSAVRIHILESCAEENTKAIADLKTQVELQEKNFGSDYWSFNEIFMRMHDLEEKVETQGGVIQTLEEKIVN